MGDLRTVTLAVLRMRYAMTFGFAPRISITIDTRALILTIYLLHHLGFL